MKNRTNRIAEEMKKEISDIIQNQIKDPRLPPMVSVVRVEVTRDLRYARVYASVLGDDASKEGAIAALKSASGFIRREVGQRIKLRYTPELVFELDDSIEHGVYMSRLIDEVVKNKEEQ
ncbi:MAG TPA: 30S ribosome-binding factor RbfA [Clostridiaceae bacterium]|nr:30S ribosome-binding factor RbfA [Clostridiaceae bacterium]